MLPFDCEFLFAHPLHSHASSIEQPETKPIRTMRIVHQNSLHQEAACTLQKQIFAGARASGSFIDEVALRATPKISRTPLREAPKVLTAKGLLRSQHSGLAA